MELNEIKKALYKQKPIAYLRHTLSNGSKTYGATFENGYVRFFVPVEEMGDTVFGEEMPSQLLIRWIKPHENNMDVSPAPKLNGEIISPEVYNFLRVNGTIIEHDGDLFMYYPFWVEVVDVEKRIIKTHTFEYLPETLIQAIKDKRGEA